MGRCASPLQAEHDPRSTGRCTSPVEPRRATHLTERSTSRTLRLMCRSRAAAGRASFEVPSQADVRHAVWVPSVRYLLPNQLSGALRRNHQVEQLLGVDVTAEELAVVRWMTICTAGDGFELRLHVSEDVGSADFVDVSAFPSAHPDDEYGEGLVVATNAELDELLQIAAGHGASLDRWVNLGVIGEEYLDAHKSGSLPARDIEQIGDP